MTFIQPNKSKDLVNVALVALVAALLAGTFWVVIAYNKTVDLEHDITTAKATLETVGAENTTMNNQLIGALGISEAKSLAAASSLIEEKKPHYFRTDTSWPIASQ